MSVATYVDDDDVLLCPSEDSFGREPIITQAELHQNMMHTWLTIKTVLYALGLFVTSSVLFVAVYFLVRAEKSNT